MSALNANKAELYIHNVVNGNIVVGKYIRLLYERHFRDLKRSKKKDYPYRFDAVKAGRAIDLFELQRLAEGKNSGQRFELMPWQAAILYLIFGWREKSSGLRRYRKVYIKVARGNAKTEFLAGLANLCFLFESERDPQVFWIATKRDQAKIGFRRQRRMLELLCQDYQKIAQMVTMTAGRILETKGLGFCMPLGKDSKTEDGFSPSLVLVDEYHAHPSDDMLHVMESGTVKRESPLVCIITTAGKNPYSPCAEFEKKCKSAMDGDFLNPQLLPVIYDLDDGDDWRDPSCWIKANPSLGVTITLDALKSEFEKAITEGPQKESDFKTKNLNVWVHSDKPWIPLEVIRRCRGEVDEAALSDRVCFGGLDLSRSRDITAFVLFFPASEQTPGNYAVFRFFCPKENAEARSRKDGVPYLEWAEKGRLILTPGDVIDTDYIANYIRLMRSKFTKMHSIAFDRWRALPMVRDLNVEFGAVYHTQTKEFMEGYSQTTAHFNAPICELERLIYTNDFIYDGSEVFEWMMRNVRLYLDTNGNAKVDKAKSTDKVDGVVALLMAMGQWMTYREHMKDVFSPDSDIILI